MTTLTSTKKQEEAFLTKAEPRLFLSYTGKTGRTQAQEGNGPPYDTNRALRAKPAILDCFGPSCRVSGPNFHLYFNSMEA
ncbi:unnamed protein product [Dovyalis caffra]|uniref:Uncharacterized protein n=1 Tax=Dovyalis caffra TaxID=77055 RepID=A0AAV1QTL6_9ROSI|nr:unnamed protein product [Dovyalis caffra]